MLPLREYLSERRQEIQAQLKALKAELAELDAAATAVGLSENVKLPAKERGTTGSGKKTIKELAIEALTENPDGLEATGIVDWIFSERGFSVARESLSPQLSRLKDDKRVILDGSIWKMSNWRELFLSKLDVSPPNDSSNLFGAPDHPEAEELEEAF